MIAAAALAALTALRLLVAALTPLTPDEAYYWVWSRALAGGYYDHPPMVALWIRAGTSLAGDTPLGVRLLAPLATALVSLAFAYAGTVLTGDRARGIMAAVLLNATLAFGAGAVSMTPDTPLLSFWILAVAALAHLSRGGHGAWFLAVGLCAGLALASKYTAIFLGFSVLLWLLLVPSQRRWLRGPWPWLGGLVALAVFAPVLLWNFEHDWLGFLRQGKRLEAFHPTRAAFNLLELIGGQIGMLTPLIFALGCAGVVVAARRGWRVRDPALLLLLSLTLPPLPVFLWHTLSDSVQGNWPAIIYPSVILLATLAWPRLHRPAAALGLAMTLPIYFHAAWPVLPVPPKLDPSLKRMAGWPGFAAEVDAARHAAGARFIAADNYALASMLAWHLPGHAPVIGVGSRWTLFDLPRPDLAAQRGILVRSFRLRPDFDQSGWAELTELGTASRSRGGAVVERYRIYDVVVADGESDLAVLPPPRTAAER